MLRREPYDVVGNVCDERNERNGTMSEWIKIGTRFLNLSNVAEVRLHEQPRFARIYFIHGATVDLDEDDSEILLNVLAERAVDTTETHRSIVAPAAS